MQSTKTTDQADRWTQDEFEARIEELLNEARSTPVDRKHDARRASNGSSIAMTRCATSPAVQGGEGKLGSIAQMEKQT